jgi:hypothetical protein
MKVKVYVCILFVISFLFTSSYSLKNKKNLNEKQDLIGIPKTDYLLQHHAVNYYINIRILIEAQELWKDYQAIQPM